MNEKIRAFFNAVRANDSETVKTCIADGVNVNREDPESKYQCQTALMQAAGMGYVQLATLLLARGAEVNIKNRWGDTGLMKAVEKGQGEIVEVLLAHGAEVNAKTGSGRTTLLDALPHREIVKRLLAHGADVNAQDSDDSTALLLSKYQIPHVTPPSLRMWLMVLVICSLV